MQANTHTHTHTHTHTDRYRDIQAHTHTHTRTHTHREMWLSRVMMPNDDWVNETSAVSPTASC